MPKPASGLFMHHINNVGEKYTCTMQRKVFFVFFFTCLNSMKKLPMEIVFDLKSVHLEAKGFPTYLSILVSHSMFIWNRWAASVVRVGERFHENCACYVFTASMKTVALTSYAGRNCSYICWIATQLNRFSAWVKSILPAPTDRRTLIEVHYVG